MPLIEALQIKTAERVNASPHKLSFELHHHDRPVRVEVEPWGSVEVPEEWVRPREWDRRKHPSVLELTAPQLVPPGDKRYADARRAAGLEASKARAEAPKTDGPKADGK